jgi:hypothetical protein
LSLQAISNVAVDHRFAVNFGKLQDELRKQDELPKKGFQNRQTAHSKVPDAH